MHVPGYHHLQGNLGNPMLTLLWAAPKRKALTCVDDTALWVWNARSRLVYRRGTQQVPLTFEVAKVNKSTHYKSTVSVYGYYAHALLHSETHQRMWSAQVKHFGSSNELELDFRTLAAIRPMDDARGSTIFPVPGPASAPSIPLWVLCSL